VNSPTRAWCEDHAKFGNQLGDQIAREFCAVVNMSAEELCRWLATEKSKSAGWKGRDGRLAESVGHASGCSDGVIR
jgi:hypothetical protein